MNRLVPVDERTADNGEHPLGIETEHPMTAQHTLDERPSTNGTSPSGPHIIPAIKLAMPSLPEDYIARPSLVAQIENAPAGQIILINAPAGYGKTLLLAEWAATHRDRIAWVTFDEDDNCPSSEHLALMAA